MFDVPYCCAFYGHSHAARLFTAYDALVTENGEENIKPIFKFGLLRGLEKMLDDDDDSPDLHTEVRSLIENMNSEPEPEVIVTILKGSATNVFSQPRHLGHLILFFRTWRMPESWQGPRSSPIPS